MFFARPVIAAILAMLLLPATAQAAVSCGGQTGDGTMACTVDPAIDPQALCNDGTAPVFWIRPGTGAGVTRWVIWLEGGGQCTDQPSCAARALGQNARFVTANGFGPGNGQGILASDPGTNPVLSSANTVLIHYCSSDLWSGNQPASTVFDPNDPTTWNFEGRRIALAAVASLGELGLGFANATQVILGGSSAGGVGITVTGNDILNILPPAADLRLIDDAGYAINIGQYDATLSAPYVHATKGDAFSTLILNGIALWNGRGDLACDSTAATPQAHVACYTGAVYTRQDLQLPVFLAESQLDLAQISDELCPAQYGNCAVPHDPKTPQGQYATAFAQKMQSDLVAGGPPVLSVYSPDAYSHVLLANNQFTTRFSFPSGAQSPRDAVDAWLTGPVFPRSITVGDAPGVSLPRQHRR